MQEQEYDVVVVGAGPAGCSTAICCAGLGFKVLLVDRRASPGDKPCGGVLPGVAAETIEDIVGEALPESVMASPPELGLFYVPPSGPENGGRVRGYSVLNIDRAELNRWLARLVTDAGVKTLWETSFISVEEADRPVVHLNSAGSHISVPTDYVVGADGVRSRVRYTVTGQRHMPVTVIKQDRCPRSGQFEDDFYAFFNGHVSPAYSYVIPKDGGLLIGTGSTPHDSVDVSDRLLRFYDLLQRDFSFQGRPTSSVLWAIPFGAVVLGRGRTLLTGDAAGLCNPLSGEGIRLAVESGESAAAAIRAASEGGDLLEAYSREVSGTADMVRSLTEYVVELDDDGREAFVRAELSR